MEKLRPWCDQPTDRGRLKNRTVIQSIIRVFLEWSNFQVIKTLQDLLEVGNNLPSGINDNVRERGVKQKSF